MKNKVILICILMSITLTAQQSMHIVYSTPNYSLLNADVFKKGSELVVFGNDNGGPPQQVFFTIDSAGQVISAKKISGYDWIASSVGMVELPNQEYAIIVHISVAVNFHSYTMIAKFNSFGNLIWAKQRFPS